MMLRRAIIWFGSFWLFMGSQNAVRAAAPDPFAGDERMAAKRTIRIHDMPMPDFLADLNLQTGIRLFAEKPVANDKITLFALDRPLSDTLRSVAGFFKFEWRRDGAAKDYGYTLAQSPEYVAAQDKARRDRTAAVADVIMSEISAFDKYSLMSEGQLQARQSTITTDLAGVTDPARKSALQLENAVIAQLLARSDWRKLLNKFLRTLSREQIIDLMLAGVTDYAWPAVPGAKTIPDAVMKEFRSNNDFSTLNITPSMGESNFVKLRFSSDYRREPVLRWQMTLGRRNIHGRRGMDFASSLPSTAIMIGASLRDPPEQLDWKSTPALTGQVKFEVRSAAPKGKSVIDIPTPRPTLGEGLDTIDKSVPIDAIADCFFTTRMPSFALSEKAIGDAMAQMSYA